MEKLDKINRLLSKLDKNKLCEFIRKECINDNQLMERFLSLGAGTVVKVSPARYSSRVKDLIEKFSGRNGYIGYNDAYEFNVSVCRIINEADTAMHDNLWDVAFAVLSGISEVGDDIINCGDDSNGDLGAIIEECFDKWHELCKKEELPANMKNKIFDYSVVNFIKGNLRGWDWWWDWIKIAISLADTSEKQNKLIKVLDDVINRKGDEWSDSYNARTAQEYKLEIMSKIGTEEERVKFLYANLDNPEFRNRLMQMSWDKGDYDEVLRLAKDGINHDSEFPGLLYDWYKWEFMVYRKKGDNINLLPIAEYFFISGGRWGDVEFSMENIYSVIKSIIDKNEWGNYINKLLAKKSVKDSIVCTLYIYTQEKMWSSYMEYLRKNPSLYNIEEAPKEVHRLYKDELVGLYSSEVKRYFMTASSRDSYRMGVGYLRNLIKYGGKAEAEEIIVEQKNRRPRRPALIEELSKL